MFKKRLIGQERGEYEKLYRRETNQIMKRPLYLVGYNITFGLSWYFTWRFIGFDFGLATMGMTIVACGTFFVIALIRWFLSEPPKLEKLLVRSWLIWILILGLLMSKPSGSTRWEYLVYVVLVWIGWGFSQSAINNHFVEKIYQQEKNGKE